MCGVTVAIIYECVRQRRFSHFFAASGWCFLWVATFLASRFFFSHSGVWMHRNIAHHAPSSSSARWLLAVRLDEQTRTTTLLSTGPETPDVRNCSGLYRFKDFRTNLIDSAEKREETSPPRSGVHRRIVSTFQSHHFRPLGVQLALPSIC